MPPIRGPACGIESIDEQLLMRYLHLDVFTSRPLEGNQLAVFPDPPDLGPEQMQAIAREMAFSETTFVYPPAGEGDVRLRIFTPGRELPIAGHPTIGTTFALAAEGMVEPWRDRFVFELGVGPTPVSLEWIEGRLAFVWMTQPLPAAGGVVEDRAAVAAALGVAGEDLVGGLPVQMLSSGVPYVYVPLRTRAAVDTVSVDRRALVRCLKGAGLEELPVFVLTTDTGGGETVYTRMLGPALGITEDPATGSASGPLGAYLVLNGVVTPEGARNLISLQGVAMGRPSRVHISVDSANGTIAGVRVGGESVLVGRGELEIS